MFWHVNPPHAISLPLRQDHQAFHAQFDPKQPAAARFTRRSPISKLLALRWDAVELETGIAITRHADNKGTRDEVVALHPIVVEHPQPLQCFHPNVFPWKHHRRTLDREFAKRQDGARIRLSCNDSRPHDCTPACHRYGFHDERRAFATMNAENITREALQTLMRHQSPLTAARYINMAKQINPAVANLHVPGVLKTETA